MILFSKLENIGVFMMRIINKFILSIFAIIPISTILLSSVMAKSIITDSQWPKVDLNPNHYKNDRVDITGQIMTKPLYQSPLTQYEIFVDPQNFSESTIVIIRQKPRFKNGTYVEVKGYIYGSVSGQNMFGGTVTAPAVIASSIKQISQTQAEAPTIALSTGSKYFPQNGLALRIVKVEYAKTETRVYLQAVNKSGSNITFDDFDATLIQGTHQLKQIDSFDTSYPEFPTPMANGVVAQEVLVFGPATLGGVPLHFDIGVSSDNFNLNFNDYEFIIHVPR